MSDIRTVGRNQNLVVGNDDHISPLTMTDGALASSEWLQHYVNRGHGYIVTIGAFSTPIVGGGDGTILDQNQPEGMFAIPSGVTMMPYRISVQTLVPLIATDADEAEILIAVDKDTVFAEDGTTTIETPVNLRMNSAKTSSVVAESAATADITNPTLDLELARAITVADVQATQTNVLTSQLDLLYEPKIVPALVGPCGLYLYWGGTVAVSGFAQIEWVEFDSTMTAALFP